MKTVSTSSGILEKMKSMTHSPQAPSPYALAADVQTVSRKESVVRLLSRCGTVRIIPQKLFVCLWGQARVRGGGVEEGGGALTLRPSVPAR